MNTAAIDPFTIEIVKKSLGAIGDEMFHAQRRTSMSPIIYESLDFGVGLTDGAGRLVTQGNGIPGFIGTLDSAVRAVLDKFPARSEIRPGDVFVTNDPYGGGGTHLSDVTLLKPIFHDGEIIAWAANKAHWTEIGGKDAGSFSADSTEVYQEGLQLPTIKLFEAGVPVQGLLDLIAANVRLPAMTIGDVWAGVAALKVGERRISELIAKYGAAIVARSIDALLDHSAAVVRKKFALLPKGEFEAEEWVDDDGLGNGPFRVHAKVTITADEFAVDYSGSDPQAPGAVNNTASGLLSAVRQVFMGIVDPSMVANEGCFRQLRIICPEGNICKARRPAPVSSYYEAMIAATDVVWRALAEVCPERLPAGQFGSICSVVIAGRHSRTGEDFILVEPLAGGWGAASDRNGENGQFCVGNGETSNIPIEIAETRYGLKVRRYGFADDLAGAGQYRGGKGIVLEYEVTCASGVYFSSMFGRTRTPPWGLRGGSPGGCNYVEIVRKDGTVVRFGKCNRVRVEQSEVIRLVTGGGGGWGSAADRRTSEIMRDIEDGFLTEDDARIIYPAQMRGAMESKERGRLAER
jgi:N-methylhydantoinase B